MNLKREQFKAQYRAMTNDELIRDFNIRERVRYFNMHLAMIYNIIRAEFERRDFDTHRIIREKTLSFARRIILDGD